MATWTSLTYAFGSLLTSAKMTQNQDNFTALAEGASGAPAISWSNALDTGFTGSSQAIGASSTWTPSAGVYQIVSTSTNIQIELFVSGAWRTANSTGDICYMFDGSNMRVKNPAGAGVTVYYQLLD